MIRRILLVVALLLTCTAQAQQYNRFGPVTGVLVGNVASPQTAAATSANIIGLWTGTCNSTTYLRADGTCQVASTAVGANPTGTIGLTAVNGVSTNFVRADGAPALSQAITPTWTGAHIWSNSTTFNGAVVMSSTGTIGGASFRDASNLFNTGTVPAARLPGTFNGFANPTASAGLTAVNGSAATAMRSDGAPAIDQTITPTWTAKHIFSDVGQFGVLPPTALTNPGNVTIGGATTGAVTVFRFGAMGHINLYRANGSLGSPTVVASGDTVGAVRLSGYDGITDFYYSGAEMQGIATNTWNGTTNGMKMRLQATAVGANTLTTVAELEPALIALTATSTTVSGTLGVTGTATVGNLTTAGTVAATTAVTVNGQNVCQANGTNCPSAIASSGASATSGATNSLPSAGTLTVLALSTEEFDTGNFHDNVTNNSRVILPGGTGYASCSGSITIATGNSQVNTLMSTDLWLRKNGTSNIAVASDGAFFGTAGLTYGVRLTVTNVMIPANGTDYVELVAAQNGASTNGTVNANTNTTTGTTRLTCTAQ